MISMGIEKDRPCNNTVCRIKLGFIIIFLLEHTSAGKLGENYCDEI